MALDAVNRHPEPERGALKEHHCREKPRWHPDRAVHHDNPQGVLTSFRRNGIAILRGGSARRILLAADTSQEAKVRATRSPQA